MYYYFRTSVSPISREPVRGHRVARSIPSNKTRNNNTYTGGLLRVASVSADGPGPRPPGWLAVREVYQQWFGDIAHLLDLLHVICSTIILLIL